MSNTKVLLGGITLLLAAAGSVQASTPDPLLTQIKRCAAMTADSDRLACYDAMAGSADKAAASRPAASNIAAPAAPTAAVPTTAEASTPAAGAAPSTADFGVHNGPLEAKKAPQREKRMLAVVGSVSHRSRGELVVTLDNGQVWVQLQPSDYPLKPGDHVEIDVGALGSYVLWAPSLRRATKVDRIS